MASTTNYTVKELKQLIRELGGKICGNKPTLIDRLHRLRTGTALDSDYPRGKRAQCNVSTENSIEVPSDETCVICMDDITSEPHKTHCNHYFHKKCLEKWLERKKNCPLCRQYTYIPKKLDMDKYKRTNIWDYKMVEEFIPVIIDMATQLKQKGVSDTVANELHDQRDYIIENYMNKKHNQTIKEMCKIYDKMRTLL